MGRCTLALCTSTHVLPASSSGWRLFLFFWVYALLQGSDPEGVALVAVAMLIIIVLDSQFRG